MKTIESSHVQEKRWTLREYDRLLAKGFFRNARVELIEGRIIKMAAKYEPHVASVSLTAKAVEDGLLAMDFGSEDKIRCVLDRVRSLSPTWQLSRATRTTSLTPERRRLHYSSLR